MGNRCCIVVPFFRDRISMSDVWEVGRLVKQRDPSLQWKPVANKTPKALGDFRQPSLPAVLLQFHGIYKRSGLPQFKGPRLDCTPVPKLAQLEMLEQAGLPVPKWTTLTPSTEIDPDTFGEHLIVKPTAPRSSLGRGVSLIRTSQFQAYRDGHAARCEAEAVSPPLVQKFIRTGERPLHYRVLTFMGRVVHSATLENLEPTPFERLSVQQVLTDNVASNSGERRGWLFEDEELFALAGRVAKVFDSTVMGIDFIRSQDTGEAFVLEVNMGDVWVFSSALARKPRERLGLEAIKSQHNAFPVVADAIVERISAMSAGVRP